MSAIAIDSDKIGIQQLSDAQSTLLMPLWARAVESRRDEPILQDSTAERIVRSLDFDFQRFESRRVPVVDYCLRARVIDQVVQQFLDQHPAATVVELGVGLDTRFDRLANDGATWFEMDLPPVMQLRRQFFGEHPGRTMIAGSIRDTDWLDQISDASPPGPLLFVAEGVLYFFEQEEIQQIVSRLADRFPGGGLVFDAQSPWFLRLSNWRHPLDDSQLTFSLGNIEQIQRWDHRLSVRQYIGFGDSPYYDQGMSRLSPLRRWGRRCMPAVRHLFKVVHVGW